MEEFKDVLTTRRYTNAYWQNRFGQFYLKHKDYDSAINYFERGIATYPDASEVKNMYNGLGNAYTAKGYSKEAKKAYKLAVEIDKTN